MLALARVTIGKELGRADESSELTGGYSGFCDEAADSSGARPCETSTGPCEAAASSDAVDNSGARPCETSDRVSEAVDPQESCDQKISVDVKFDDVS
ncbi:hypothetical protein L1987_08384 [Smallanthus sonchifolius]|uniref:Uncharacterized protein n=1 Tax=Smallanthus sonchifolius TaxID=185202 RepID=A0ACB9JMR9_9ASTR|nr:hypothetical protein L1987_08384 [Smallanthus sonchifolius]